MAAIENNSLSFSEGHAYPGELLSPSNHAWGITEPRDLVDYKKIADKSFQCLHCPKTFTRKNDAARHIKTPHMGLKPYKCELCNKNFGQSHQLRLHKEKNHTRERTEFTCCHCSKVFQDNSQMRRHEDACGRKRGIEPTRKIRRSKKNAVRAQTTKKGVNTSETPSNQEVSNSQSPGNSLEQVEDQGPSPPVPTFQTAEPMAATNEAAPPTYFPVQALDSLDYNTVAQQGPSPYPGYYAAQQGPTPYPGYYAAEQGHIPYSSSPLEDILYTPEDNVPEIFPDQTGMGPIDFSCWNTADIGLYNFGGADENIYGGDATFDQNLFDTWLSIDQADTN